MTERFDMVIVGAGFAGLYMLHSARRLGLRAVIIEAGDDVGAMMEVGVTADYDERWGSFNFVPPRRFVESVVASLQSR